MGIYFRAVTGSPTTLPYTLYHKAYSCPVFIWQSGWPQVEYSNKEFTEFFQREAGMFENSRTLHGWLANVHWMLSELFQGAGLLLIPLAALPFAWRRSGVRFGIATGLFVPLVDLLTPWFWWRYWLPALGMFSVASVQCTRHLRLCRVGRWRWGITMVHALLLCTTLSLFFRMAYNGYSAFRQRGNPVGFERRYRIQQQFQASGRKHLIIVHYRSGHSPNQDWIGNGADFDSDPVLWARDLSPESNDRLVQYFKGREAWWVDADAPQLEVVSYSEAKEKLRSRP
jgi:hypothetical protein